MRNGNLADGLAEQAAIRPRSVAIALDDASIDFALLDALVWSCASFLAQAGLARGRVAAMLLADELTIVVATLACARLGATCLTLAPDTPAPLLGELLQRTRTDRVFHGPGVDPAALPCPAARLDRAAYAARHVAPVPALRDPEPAAPLLIVVGSGTTGRAKLFPVTHRQLAHGARFCAESLSLSPDDRYVSMPHMIYVSPKERAIATLLSGGTVVLHDRRRVDFDAVVARHRVTVVDATVFHAHQLLARQRTRTPAFPGLRVLQLSGSNVDDSLRARIVSELTPSLWIRYGTNETGLIAICDPANLSGPSGTVGRVHPGVEVALLDEAGAPVIAGRTGRVRVRSPAMIDRYLDDEDANRLAFRDGWWHPGDLAAFAPDGQLLFRGRADQMMIFNGNNIYPAHLEAVVGAHEAVDDCVAFPMAHAVSQDVPVCAVALRPGAHATEEQLLAFCRARLGALAPVRVFVLDRVPRNEPGKVIRAELREAVARLLARERAGG